VVPPPDYVSILSTRIILKYIPKNTTNGQILQFIKPALKGGLFSKSGTIERISVLVQKDRLSDTMMYHAILYVQPDQAAKRIISKLDGKPLNGHPIAVKEYVERCIHHKIAMDDLMERKHVSERRNSAKLFRLITIEQLKDFTWAENA
jgi:hypothetical protein